MTRKIIGYVETKLVLVVLLIACLCGVTVSGVSRHLAAVQADTERLVARNLRSRHLVQVMSTIQDAETGQRGYLLTGRDEYLMPYLGAVDDIKAGLSTLEADYAGIDPGQAVVASIGRRARDKFVELRLAVETRRTQGLEAAQRIVLQDTGLHLMDAIRADVGRLLDAERADIDRLARRQSAAAMSDAKLWVGAVFVVLLPVGFCLVLAMRDARRGRHRGAELAHVSSHDALTGLLNRPALMTRLGEALARRPREVGLLFLDLNDFKAVNDELGHAVGDRVLAAVAACLRGAVRPHDAVARLGGDEFVVVMEPCPSRQVLEALATRIETALDAIRLTELGERRVGGSVGSALSTEQGISPTSLLEAADAAMYERKAELRRTRPQPSRLHLVSPH